MAARPHGQPGGGSWVARPPSCQPPGRGHGVWRHGPAPLLARPGAEARPPVPVHGPAARARWGTAGPAACSRRLPYSPSRHGHCHRAGGSGRRASSHGPAAGDRLVATVAAAGWPGHPAASHRGHVAGTQPAPPPRTTGRAPRHGRLPGPPARAARPVLWQPCPWHGHGCAAGLSGLLVPEARGQPGGGSWVARPPSCQPPGRGPRAWHRSPRYRRLPGVGGRQPGRQPRRPRLADPYAWLALVAG